MLWRRMFRPDLRVGRFISARYERVLRLPVLVGLLNGRQRLKRTQALKDKAPDLITLLNSLHSVL
jgi:hypothetical protein